MKTIQLTFVISLILSPCLLKAQDQQVVDSLLKVLQTDVADTSVINIYKSIAKQYMDVDTTLTFEYANKAMEVAQKIGDQEQLLRTEFVKAQSYWRFNKQSSKAEEWYLSLLSRSRELGSNELIGHANSRLFLFYHDSRAYDKAIEYGKFSEDYWGEIGQLYFFYIRLGNASMKLDKYEEAIETYNKGIASTADSSELAVYNAVIGNSYRSLGISNRALKYLILSSEIYQELNDTTNLAASYNRIAAVYEEEKDWDAAIEMHLKAEKIWAETNHPWLPFAQGGLGRCYANTNEPAKSFSYYKSALRGYQASSDKYSVALTLQNLAEGYYKVDSLYLAEENAIESIRGFDQIKAYGPKGVALGTLGDIKKKNGQIRSARDAYAQARTLLEEAGMTKYLSSTSKKLSLAEQELGDYKGAYNSLLLHKKLEDSLKSEEQIKEFTRMQSEYEFDQERDSIHFANEKEQLLLNEQIIQEQNRQYAAIAGVAVLIIVLTILYRYYRLKQRSNKELQTAYDQLRDTQSQLIQSEKMAAVGQLTAGIAHELNNPINAINASTTGIEADINDLMILLKCYENGEKYIDDPKLAKEIQELKAELDLDDLRQLIPEVFEDIKNGAKRMVRIIGGLTKFSRREEAEKVDMNVHQGIEETLTLIRVALKNKVEVIKNFAEDLPRIKAYPSELNQVVLNIMVNAEQAIEEHGTLTITTKKDSDHVVISFKYTGHGMDEETLNRIFEPFFTTKKVGLGTGLGMSISHRIIENHDGEIEINSEVGKGSEFIIKIPST